jgi:uncharacterized protein (DUF2336 family)
VSSTDFRQITIKGDGRRAERLFRAAVSAFCSLTRATRRDVAQLEDLVLPLFEQVSVEARRYVSAALSECQTPPPALVRRLADESVDIAAPLLIRSTALSDADLVTLIGRHGYAHARAIGRRPDLNPAIAGLVAILERKVIPLRPRTETNTRAAARPAAQPATKPATDETLHRLRDMMRPASALRLPEGSAYEQLRATVLSGRPGFFQAALAEALDRDADAVRDTSANVSYAWLLDALRVLNIEDEKAFLVTAAFYPGYFGDLNAIRLFLLRYAAISREEARRRVSNWRVGDLDIADLGVGTSGLRVAGRV